MKTIQSSLVIDLINRSVNHIPLWDEDGCIYTANEDSVSVFAHENNVILYSILDVLQMFKVCSRENQYIKFDKDCLKKISLLDLFY